MLKKEIYIFRKNNDTKVKFNVENKLAMNYLILILFSWILAHFMRLFYII